jgi:hypothetical protein
MVLMTQDDAELLLERAAIFRHPCDLDLLLFFVRHPRTLLSSESLATFLGYELKQIGDSLELLLGGGLIKRTQTTAHAARLYLLVANDGEHKWLPQFWEMASTRGGRGLLMKALRSRRNEGTDQPSVAEVRPKTLSNTAPPRPFQPRGDKGRDAGRRLHRRGGQ